LPSRQLYKKRRRFVPINPGDSFTPSTEYAHKSLAHRYQSIDSEYYFEQRSADLNKTELAGSCNRLGPSLNLKLCKDSLVVAFYGDQRQKKPLADLLIREPLRNQF